MHFVASPRHADVLLVTGPVSRHMETALRRTWRATPAPKPLDFIARLAALASKTLALLAGWALPKPRVNLTRFHGVFAPNSKHRAVVTPARRGKGNKPKAIDDGQAKRPAERRAFNDLGAASTPAGTAAAR